MNNFDIYNPLIFIPFVFSLLANAMARLMMEAAYKYRKKKSELKKIEKRLRHPITYILCPYSFYKPTFAPKHLLFAWILRLFNILNESTMIVLLFSFKMDFPIYRIIHLIIGCFNLLFSIYSLSMREYNEINLEKSFFVKWDNLM